MKNCRFIVLLVLTLTLGGNPSAIAQKKESPYELDLVKDATWMTLGLGGSAAGFLIIQNKEGLTEAEVLGLNADDVNWFDRFAAGSHDDQLSTISDFPFAASFAAPFAFMFGDGINDNFGQVSFMYIESLATTAALFTLSAGLTRRVRPRAYSSDLDMAIRQKSSNTRSFYSGHVAAAATGTFFAAKIYNDFYPDSPSRWIVWTGAAVVPAAVGALRIGAGQHFLTDVLLGYGMGMASGILIPELHKKGNENLSFMPYMGRESNGIYLSYTF